MNGLLQVKSIFPSLPFVSKIALIKWYLDNTRLAGNVKVGLNYTVTNRKKQSMELDSLGHRNPSCTIKRKYLDFSNLVMFSITDLEKMKRIFHHTGFVTTYTMMKQHVHKEQFYLYLQYVSFRILTLSQQDKNISYKCGFKCLGRKNVPLKMYSTFQKLF